MVAAHCGTSFGVLAIYALATGDAFDIGRRGEPSRHILREVDLDGFISFVRYFCYATAISYFLGFVRLVPIEDGIRKIRDHLHEKISEKGYDKKPAPWWGYLILLGFLVLIIWIGKITMYSE